MYGKTSQLFSCKLVIYSSFRVYSSKSTKRLLEFLGTMPKPNTTRIAEAQKQRLNIKKKSEKYSASTVYLQVLGSGARGAPNALYLFTDQKRYLFNCGEGTQRLAHEHKVKLSRLEHVFITSKTWRNLGGLPGLSLTLQDVGVPNITLHGPEGLDNLYTATKRFVTMKEMNVKMANCSPSQDFEDNCMTVKYVLLGPPQDVLPKSPHLAKKPKLTDDKQYEEFMHDDTDYYRRERGKRRLDEKNKNEKEPLKTTEKILHHLQSKSNCTVAYICTLHKRYGTLDLEKCVAAGVKPGPLLGELKSGKDVVLPDGTLVLAKDVKTPDDPGPVFIVLEVPDISYLDERPFADHFFSDANPPERVPAVIAHYTPPHVMRDPAYRAFIKKFGPSTVHINVNESNSCLGSEAVHRTQNKLHLLSTDMFPLLRDASIPAAVAASDVAPCSDKMEELKNKIALAQFQSIVNCEAALKKKTDTDEACELTEARTLTMFHLRPKNEIDRSAEPKLRIQEYIQETLQSEGCAESLDKFNKAADAIKWNDQRQYPKVIFLGTGSCIPSKTRNTSAIVLQIDENHSMLLDCGEGTFGQLVRFFGPNRVNAFMRTLKAIYVSHLHADHHIGLIGVMQARQRALEESESNEPPLLLLAPGQIMSWLSLYDQQFEPLRHLFTLVPNQTLLHDATTRPELSPAALASLGLSGLRTCLVSHCPNAFGVAVDIGWDTITYSGDTIPCEELCVIGKNSTLLIHEATMEDELAHEARIKMHSTTSQAIEIGQQMNAKYIVLTHFSQRYARIPRLNADLLNDNRKVGIAFDNMQITPSDLELLPLMYAPLQLMFAEHCVEMELKAKNREYRALQRRGPSPTPSTSPLHAPESKGTTDGRDISNDLQNATISNGVGVTGS